MLENLSSQTKGTLICLLGVSVLTPDSLLVQLVSATLPDMEVIFYKYLFMFAVLLLILIQREKANILLEISSLGWLQWTTAILWGLSNLTINFAFQNTNVACVLVICATDSLFAALGSYFLLNEQLKYRTMLTITACFGSLIFILFSETSDPNANPMGIFSALIASITLGTYLVLLRYIEKANEKEFDSYLCNCLSSLFVVLATLPFASNFVPLQVDTAIYLTLNGMIVLPVAFVLLTIGPTLISAPEVSLYMLIETVFGPIWVFVGGFGAPSVHTLIGGGIIVSALAIHSAVALVEELQTTRSKVSTEEDLDEEQSSGKETTVVVAMKVFKSLPSMEQKLETTTNPLFENRMENDSVA